MEIVKTLKHLFIPHFSNNQKARVIHSSNLILISALLLGLQFSLKFAPRLGVNILGYAAQISVEELIGLTNEKRVQNGLSPLILNQELVSAATAKGADMLARDYWAHVAPDGAEPWKFFTEAGYKYRFAGENLARDFSSAGSAVEAWMASPSHRENMLSEKYKEVGLAVVEGDLAGVDTTIIVSLFGTRYQDTVPAVPVAKAQKEVIPVATERPSVVVEEAPQLTQVVAPVKTSISPFEFFKKISLVVLEFVFIVMVVDGIYVYFRGISRVAGRNLAHLSFLGMVAAIVVILKAGRIL